MSSSSPLRIPIILVKGGSRAVPTRLGHEPQNDYVMPKAGNNAAEHDLVALFVTTTRVEQALSRRACIVGPIAIHRIGMRVSSISK